MVRNVAPVWSRTNQIYSTPTLGLSQMTAWAVYLLPFASSELDWTEKRFRLFTVSVNSRLWKRERCADGG